MPFLLNIFTIFKLINYNPPTSAPSKSSKLQNVDIVPEFLSSVYVLGLLA